ncbi:MAG: hypothetical protein JWN64_379 [Parcubacteria group bacterium]|nr:hypothetical protein [Parcubacteria group bacterium]
MHARRVLSLGNFFSVAHFYLILPVIVPYLATMLPADSAGLVVSAGALFTLIAFMFMPRLIRKYGARKLALFFGYAQAVTLVLLGENPGPVIAIAAVAIACALAPLIAYQLDLLLEATVSEENSTGRVRTAFLTAGNVALVLAPIAVGLILDGAEAYSHVFFYAGLSLTPFLVLFFVDRLPEKTPPSMHSVRSSFACMLKDKDLMAVAGSNAVLQFFYHLAPLYIPLYLHTALNFAWSDLGWMFAIMLLPYFLLEYPAGYIADRWLGDQELLLAGFVIMGLSFASLAFVTSTTPLVFILLILVLTRVGAVFAEAMTEGHFFRRITAEDASTVSIFRMMRPSAALLAPVSASVLLFAGGSYAMLFILFGLAIAAAGSLCAFRIQDIK